MVAGDRVRSRSARWAIQNRAVRCEGSTSGQIRSSKASSKGASPRASGSRSRVATDVRGELRPTADLAIHDRARDRTRRAPATESGRGWATRAQEWRNADRPSRPHRVLPESMTARKTAACWSALHRARAARNARAVPRPTLVSERARSRAALDSASRRRRARRSARSMVSAQQQRRGSTSSGIDPFGRALSGQQATDRAERRAAKCRRGTFLYLAMGTSRAVVRCEVTLPLGRETHPRVRVLIPEVVPHTRGGVPDALTMYAAEAMERALQEPRAECNSDLLTTEREPIGEAGAERYGKLEPCSATEGQLLTGLRPRGGSRDGKRAPAPPRAAKPRL